MRALKLQRFAWGLLASILGLGSLSCGSDAPASQAKTAPQEQPLQQTRSVPFQVDVGDGESVTLRMPAPSPGEDGEGSGMGGLLMQWCVYRNLLRDDDKLCGEFSPAVYTSEGGFDLTLPLSTVTGDSLRVCKASLCQARVANCVGFLAKEIETSPTDLEFSWSEFTQYDPGLDQTFNLAEYGVPQADLDKLPEDWAPASIRFSAPATPGQAALARISSFAHQYATRIGELMATADAGSGQTCAQVFATADSTSTPTGLSADVNGRVPTFTDVFVQSHMDGAIEYHKAVHRVVADMKGSAETQAMKLSPAQGTQLIWNGDVDSARSIANFIGFGVINPNSPPAPGPSSSTIDCTPGTASPTSVPVCPPGLTDRTRGITQLMRSLEVKPTADGELLAFVTAYGQFQLEQGQTPVSSVSDLAASLGVSVAELQSANDYLCGEARVFNVVQTPNGSGGALGMQPPQSQLTGAALSVNFLGAAPDGAASDPTSPQYAASGAVRGIDAVKRTSAVVQGAASQSALEPGLSSAFEDFLDGLKAEAGEHRIKWEIGSPDGSGNVQSVAVTIYGVPDLSGAPAEQFVLTQGIDALKCITTGTVDGVDCTPTDFIAEVPPTNYTASVPSDQPDLAGRGTLTATFTTLTRNGVSTAAISAAQPLYLIRRKQSEGSLVFEAFSGVLPAPEGGSPGGGVTRTVWTPAGGTLEDVLAQALTPNTNDCSKVQDTCAGLPVDLWPPLESEINGDPNTAQNFESSWKRYLTLARDASAEADRRGEELLQQGLSMDLRREQYKDQLLEYCGADGDGETGCSEAGAEANPLLADVPWATLGDKDVCAWEYEGKICGVPGGEMPAGLACPMPAEHLNLSDEEGQEAANKAACQGMIDPLLSGTEAIPVVHKLRYAASEFPPIEGLCGTFTALRQGSYVDPNTQEEHDLTSSEARSNYIRKYIAPNLSQKTVQDIMRRLVYREEFADHYTLEFDGQPIFKTDRPFGRPSSNAASLAPCKVKSADEATGSGFWTQEIGCYVSGANLDMAGDCVQDPGVGLDGCPNQGSSNADYSLDTEPEALRNRWAWGFGHLRRSVSTLGVMTGEMNDRLFIAGVWNPAAGHPTLGVTNTSLSCKNRGTTYNDPSWMERCHWFGKDHTADMWCVTLPGASGGGAGGPGGDSHRVFSGRPVNYNGFIANRVAFGHPDLRVVPAGIGEFPFFCDQPGACTGSQRPGGVDPQMVYCGFPSPELPRDPDPATFYASIDQSYRLYTGPATSFEVETSGFVGTSHVSGNAAKFKTANGNAWSDALAQMWTVPDGDFCKTSAFDLTLQGAIWKALCFQIADDSGLIDDPEFMHFGRMPHPGMTYVGARDIAHWVHVDPSKSPSAEFLFDTRKGLDKHEFQYPLTQRNIFDALELACHAQQFTKTGGVRCEDVAEFEHLPADLDQIAAMLSCYADNVNKATRNYVVPGVPKVLLEAVDKEQGISSTSGLGGQYLAEINNMHAALKQVTRGFGAIRDAHTQLSLAMKTHKSIADEDEALDAATEASKIATMLDAWATVLTATAGSNPLTGGVAMADTAIVFEAAQKRIAALEFQNRAADEQLEQKRIANIQSMVSQLGSARAGADEVVLGLNALNQAAANLRLVRKKADTAKSRMEFSDYAGDPGQDPQYVNIVMRRTYNTRLIRYQDALERAKRLAFIARRAIELRFGVDLTRLTSDMTLVDAPAGWANKICDLTGIDYAAIREPDPSGVTEKWKAGGPPPEGDDFANQYVGDYVTWLEDFVNSYPFDNPLQDGDDTAVISLRDDIMGAKGECSVPGDNLLYFSTEFDKQSPESGGGWQVEDCQHGAPVVPEDDPGMTQDWAGCITRRPSGLSALALADLPAGAVAYAVQSAACDDVYGFCPIGATYKSTGRLAQYFVPTSGQYHMASIHVLQDPTADNTQYASHNAFLRVDRVYEDGSSEPVSSTVFTPTTSWERINTPAFPVIAGELYRMVLFTLDSPDEDVTVGGPNPGYFVAAAQVEAVSQQIDGTFPATPGTWHRTDVSRNVVDPACVEAAPQGMRKNFRYKCEYICRDGVGRDCPADSADAVPVNCFYEGNFNIDLEQIEAGKLIPSGQLAIGNFNFRHNQVGINLVGTNVKTCEGVSNASCFGNGFVEYTLVHSGSTKIRNYSGDALPAKMDNAYIEHGKGLATERLITNPPSSADEQQLGSYMKREFKGRPLQGLYTIRIWDTPGLRWENLEDIQLVWKYHYWSRFQK